MLRLRSIVRRVVGAALAVTAALAVACDAGSADSPPVARRPDPTRLMFLVEYVGSDYDKAVRDGAVVDQVEYGEMLRFTRQAVEEYGAARTDDIAAGLKAFATDVAQRVDRRKIQKASRELLTLLSNRLENVPYPSATPRIDEGARFFAADCAKCHGERGAGDGPQAAGLVPPPVSFRGERMAGFSPRHIYNTLTLGVEGTGMTSFVDKYDDGERWDLAFFVMTLRDGFAPAAPAATPRVSLDEVVASTNAELLALLQSRDASASAAVVDHVRAHPELAVSVAPAAAATAASAAPATPTPSSASGSTPVASSAPPSAPANAAADAITTAVRLQDAFADIAGRISPTVVGVASFARDESDAPGAAPKRGGGWQSASGPAAPEGYRALHAGSGFLLNDAGDVATCDHLLRDQHGNVADRVVLELHDGAQVAAHVVGMEPALDLAIVRIDEAEWTRPVRRPDFGDSDDIQTGHWLVALGDPPGATTSFVVGVAAAAARRQCYQEERSATMVQSSLAIAPAALGGPVVDIHGFIVGMAVRLPGSGGDDGAATQAATTSILPVNLLSNLQAALEASGSVESPWLGISVLERELLRAQLGERAGATPIPESGVYIDDLFDPSPAAKAGVQVGDFLLALGDRDIETVGDFQQALYAAGIGNTATLKLRRGPETLTLEVPVEQRPPAATMR